ncbi:MAG: integrase family protein [candidate division NC10 bacterium]|jgi:hypothetical protein|nr:integrase family protein [candidate division NC10 bacterium]
MNAIATPGVAPRILWNKGKLIGQKPPLKLQQIWTPRTRLQLAGETHQLTPILDPDSRDPDSASVEQRTTTSASCAVHRVRDLAWRGPAGSRCRPPQHPVR